jgi:hypothetical protein
MNPYRIAAAMMAPMLVALASTALFVAPAHADLACGSLLMPAGQLKQVSRGITAHHSGLDLVAPHGSPLRAAAAGTVVAAHSYYAYGLLVDVDHGNGVLTRYAHMADFARGIRPGAQVQAGQLLGSVGRTGRATTAHVHFEVRINGRAVDPKPYLSLAACTARTPTVSLPTPWPHAAFRRWPAARWTGARATAAMAAPAVCWTDPRRRISGLHGTQGWCLIHMAGP